MHSPKTRSINLGTSSSRRAASVATDSGEDQGAGAFAPCYDGGILDKGSIGQILARSLGNAAAAVRRNRTSVGDSNTNNKGSGGGSDSGKGINQNQDQPATQSRWRSWNEAPPEALLTAEEIRNASARKDEDARRRRRPPSDVVAEVVPPLQSRRRLKIGTVNSTGTNAGRKNSPALSENATPSSSGEAAAAAAAAAAKGTPNSEARSSGSKEEGGPLSTASSARSSRRSSAGGIPLVPRVATLAAATAAADKSQAGEAARKGKDFDPDQLECVRRHEASVAEKERRVRILRTEEEKRTHFRARPLPVFLGNGGAGAAGPGSNNASGIGDGSGGGGGGQSMREQGPVIVPTGAAGTSPELLAALEQVRSRRRLQPLYEESESGHNTQVCDARLS